MTQNVLNDVTSTRLLTSENKVGTTIRETTTISDLGGYNKEMYISQVYFQIVLKIYQLRKASIIFLLSLQLVYSDFLSRIQKQIALSSLVFGKNL